MCITVTNMSTVVNNCIYKAGIKAIRVAQFSKNLCIWVKFEEERGKNGLGVYWGNFLFLSID